MPCGRSPSRAWTSTGTVCRRCRSAARPWGGCPPQEQQAAVDVVAVRGYGVLLAVRRPEVVEPFLCLGHRETCLRMSHDRWHMVAKVVSVAPRTRRGEAVLGGSISAHPIGYGQIFPVPNGRRRQSGAGWRRFVYHHKSMDVAFSGPRREGYGISEWLVGRFWGRGMRWRRG